MVLKPIARVKNEVKEIGRRDWTQVVSELVFDPGLEDALGGLEEFSHVVVLFWMHRASTQHPPTKVHPRGRADLPLVGLFATRTPYRPNPLGMSVVRLLWRKGNVLRVRGLDAIDGTPIVDIKGYFPRDSITDAAVPRWVTTLLERD